MKPALSNLGPRPFGARYYRPVLMGHKGKQR